MTQDPLWFGAITFVTGLAAGWIDAIAGGGGLITIPALLWLGVPPPMVLGTNKFQASFGSLTAAMYYVRKGVAPLNEAWTGIAFTLAGSALGAWSVQQIDPSFLGLLIPLLLLGIALVMVFVPSIGSREKTAVMPRTVFSFVFGIGLGFYDGFFGPGVGSFWAFAYVGLMGYSLVRATGFTKVMNFVSNISSFVVFMAGGHVLYSAGITMALGQMVGARLGSAMVVSRGTRFIRPIFITMVIAVAAKLAVDRLP